MKITFPHMGQLAIPLHAIFNHLNFDVVLPPETTANTIKLGSMYAPEQICMPFKINLGNLIEAHQLGADTMVMLGGCGPCRFGYYGSLLHQILFDLGIEYNFIYFDENIFKTIRAMKENCNLSWLQIYQAIRIGWEKLTLLEELADRACWIRPALRPEDIASFESELKMIITSVANAQTIHELKSIVNYFPKVKSNNEMIKVLVVGDIYTILEPECNYHLEKELGKKGVVVLKAIKISEWLTSAVRGFEKSNEGKRIIAKARPYLKTTVGGHGIHTIGNSIDFVNKVDGIVHIMPFSCTPEIVAASILPVIQANHQIPVLRLVVDEHTSDVAVNTRIEAFIDLLQRKKLKKLI